MINVVSLSKRKLNSPASFSHRRHQTSSLLSTFLSIILVGTGRYYIRFSSPATYGYLNTELNVWFEVLAAVNIKTSFFLDVVLCGLIRNDAALASRRNYCWAGQKIFSARVRFKRFTVCTEPQNTDFPYVIRYCFSFIYLFVYASFIFQ